MKEIIIKKDAHEPSKMLTVTLTDELAGKLNQKAQEFNLPKTQLIRLILTNVLDDIRIVCDS